MRGIYGMGSDNTNRRTVETEFKKAMVRVNVPVGLLVTAFGIGLMVLVGSYLIKYFRGAVPLREVYGTEQAGDEYVSFDINYVLDAFMESYRTRSGVRTKSSIYYLVLDEEAGAVPVRISGKMEAEMDRIMDETWDYLKGVRSDPPQGLHVEGTLKKLKGDGKNTMTGRSGVLTWRRKRRVIIFGQACWITRHPPVPWEPPASGPLSRSLGYLSCPPC